MNTPWNLLNSTCTITSQAFVTQADGMDKETSSTVMTAVPCRFQADNTATGVEQQRVQGTVFGEVFLPGTYNGNAVAVPKDATITIGSTIYRCLGPSYQPAGYLADVLLSVQVKRIT